MAVVTRSLLSLTAASGNPTTAIFVCIPPAGMDLDLNLVRFNADDRTRIDLGRHIRTLSCFVTNILQELFFSSKADPVGETIRDLKVG
jgi:hypothetical protein